MWREWWSFEQVGLSIFELLGFQDQLEGVSLNDSKTSYPSVVFSFLVL